MDLLSPLKFKMPRSYALTGLERAHAIEAGLAGATWYQTPVDRKLLKDMMRRSDGPALRDTAIWLGLLELTGAGGIWFWGGWRLYRFSSPMASCIPAPPTAAGMNAATAPRSRRNG